MNYLYSVIEEEQCKVPASKELFMPLYCAIKNIEGMEELFLKTQKDSSWNRIVSIWKTLNSDDDINECFRTEELEIESFFFFSEIFQKQIKSYELEEKNGEYFYENVNLTQEVNKKISELKEVYMRVYQERLSSKGHEQRMSNNARNYYSSWNVL